MQNEVRPTRGPSDTAQCVVGFTAVADRRSRDQR